MNKLPERFAWNDDIEDKTGWYDADAIEACFEKIKAERDHYKTITEEAVPIIKSMGTMGAYQKQGAADAWLKRANGLILNDRSK